MKVTIQKWNTVATWRWDIPEEDVCGICQVHFDGTCPTCKYPGDDCQLSLPEGNAPCAVNVRIAVLASQAVLVVSDLPLAFEWADQNNESAGQIE
ncbi:unnamed protein product [Clonostachys rosea]|uniref:Anaphase-promoting complex subunit 11 RING-H2 finger domain-containing protein n=1 Tax=Bionectria ochroleuca TaxID=29856 RepID=A0ABY6V0Q7_BIOOC|nr:unnamed protein product [Clonostachys rosea]